MSIYKGLSGNANHDVNDYFFQRNLKKDGIPLEKSPKVSSIGYWVIPCALLWLSIILGLIDITHW